MRGTPSIFLYNCSLCADEKIVILSSTFLQNRDIISNFVVENSRIMGLYPLLLQSQGGGYFACKVFVFSKLGGLNQAYVHAK